MVLPAQDAGKPGALKLLSLRQFWALHRGTCEPAGTSADAGCCSLGAALAMLAAIDLKQKLNVRHIEVMHLAAPDSHRLAMALMLAQPIPGCQSDMLSCHLDSAQSAAVLALGAHIPSSAEGLAPTLPCLQMYSYGAPFPGNRAFRSEFDAAIPETHNVIVDGVRPTGAPACPLPLSRAAL